MSYETTWEPSGVYWRYFGTLTAEDMFLSNQEVYGDPRFDHLGYQIADLLEVEEVELEPRKVRLLAAMDRAASEMNSRIRCAIVARGGTAQAIAEAYRDARVGPPWPVEIFEELELARAWVREEA